MANNNDGHMKYIDAVARQDCACLVEKERTYKGSWKKRGGVGAAMMLLRKVDRLEVILSAAGYDVFQAVTDELGSEVDGTALAEIRDLRRYLLLVEAELVSRGVVQVGGSASPLDGAVAPLRSVGGSSSVVEDSNKHAFCKIVDGLPVSDYEEAGLPVVHAKFIGGACGIVDRNNCDRSVWGHLPRVSLEVNAAELDCLPVEYAWMYSWDESAGKYRLVPTFVENWGKES